MSVDGAVKRLKHDIRNSGDLLLLHRLDGLESLEAIQILSTIILKELIPLCGGMKDCRQLLTYLGYLFNFACYAGDHDVWVIVSYRLLDMYDCLWKFDKSFYQQSEDGLGKVRSWLLGALIPRWVQTCNEEEATQIFRRIRKTVAETDQEGLYEIKELIRKHDGSCPYQRIELAIVHAKKDLPSENVKELIAVLSHRWVKGLDPEEIAFLAQLSSLTAEWSGRSLVHESVLRATESILKTLQVGEKIRAHVSHYPNPCYQKARLTFVNSGEIGLRVDFHESCPEEDLRRALKSLIECVLENQEPLAEDLVCRVYAGAIGSDSACEGLVTWKNWQVTSSSY